jgi:putative PEP-CTERM system integral membrane protein
MKKFLNSSFFTYGLFWSWNLLYVILFAALEMYEGFAINIIRDGFYGLTPVGFFLTALAAYLLPLVSIVLALTIFRKKRSHLVKLFYGVEVPLTLLCLLRLALLRELNPGTTQLFILLVTGMATFLFELIRDKEWQNKTTARILLVLNCALLLIAVYIFALLVFYLPPAFAGLIHLVGEIEIREIFSETLLGFTGIVFGLYTMTLLLGLPIAMLYLYYNQFRNRFRFYAVHFDRREAFLIAGFLISMNVVLYIWLNWNQPQEKILSLARDKNSQEDLLKIMQEDDEAVRKGLVNAYLASYRYLGAEKDCNHMEEIWKAAFGGDRKNYSLVTDAHNLLLKPFLYSGENFWEDRTLAEKEYEELFDASIAKAEIESIRHALKSTSQRRNVQAGLMDVGEEKVLVTRQEVNVKETGDKAEIELYECYQNQTFETQEILYYFSLPEHAVITGMWLSDDSTPKKYAYRVSPRGAAQQVYKDQVRVRVDPSLLEQVGACQYRLRAFPIEPRTVEYKYSEYGRGRPERNFKDGKKFHLWLRYEVLKNENNAWPLPLALQRRNVYCDEETEFKLNGEVSEKENDSDWLPLSVAAAGDKKPVSHLTVVDDSVVVSAVPFRPAATELLQQGERFALVIDQSYSMKKNLKKMQECMEWLENEGVFNKKRCDVYLTGKNPAMISPESFNSYDILFYGNIQHLEMLSQFDSLRGQSKYSMAILLTDQGDYEMSDDSAAIIHFDFPVYMVHADGKLPYAYSDNILETLKESKGRSFTDFKSVAEYGALMRQYSGDRQFLGYDQGYLWKLAEKKTSGRVAEIPALAAGQFIRNLRPDKDQGQTESLDKIHKIAVTNSIVTAYSSMIVLVNAEQHRQLDDAEKKDDRFERETENGKENLPSPGFSFTEVSGTPEPEEWVLIICGAAMAGYFIFRRLKSPLQFR